MKLSCQCENKDVSADSRGLFSYFRVGHSQHFTRLYQLSGGDASHAVQFGCFVIYAYLASVFIQIPWCH